jgi:hypothetical protein
MKASDVFTPGRFPAHTFVDDHLQDKKRQLLDALDTGSMLVSISGPSKSGKTVFVEECLGPSNLIQVTGAGVSRPSDLWMRVFDIVGTEIGTSVVRSDSNNAGISGRASLEGNAFIAKGRVDGEVSRGNTSTEAVSSSFAFDCLQLLISELGGTDLVVFIDDFHYIPTAIQLEIAKQIKEAVRNNVKFICASVPYRADDVIRGNPDLRGRVFSIDFGYWAGETLKKIAYKGFPVLGMSYENSAIDELAVEAAGSPQLMQYLCLNACLELGVREAGPESVTLKKEKQLLSAICRRTVLSTDYGSVVTLMKEGPKTRGSNRSMYVTSFGWSGDVYRLLVKSLSLDPPQLTFRYSSLNDRISQVCRGEGPSGSSVTSACAHSARIINGAVGESIVEWDGEHDVFDIRDPYFLFYLRWSDTTDS